MSRIDGNKLIFDDEEIISTKALLPRLIRIIFYGKSITNDDYLDRYETYYKSEHPDKNHKEFSQKSAADRKFILDKKNLTFKMLFGVLTAVGYDVESVSVRVRDRLTGEASVFSTDDTVEDLKEQIAKAKEYGISSIV